MNKRGVGKFVEYCDMTVYRRFRVYTDRFLQNAGILTADYATSHPRCLQAVKHLDITKAVSPQATVLTGSLQQVR
jgi:hypothetical protein